MKKDKITKDMTFQQGINKYPDAAEIMMNYGLHCIGCHVSAFETIEQGSKAHGLSRKEMEKMLKEINKKA